MKSNNKDIVSYETPLTFALEEDLLSVMRVVNRKILDAKAHRRELILVKDQNLCCFS